MAEIKQNKIRESKTIEAPEKFEQKETAAEAAREIPVPPKTKPRQVSRQPQKPAKHEDKIAPAKDEMLLNIEKVLEEDLSELYFSLSEEARHEFREKGQVTAKTIKQMIDDAKIKLEVMIKLIIDWLKTIPSVNKFFAEQEAKIKADKILNLLNPK